MERNIEADLGLMRIILIDEEIQLLCGRIMEQDLSISRLTLRMHQPEEAANFAMISNLIQAHTDNRLNFISQIRSLEHELRRIFNIRQSIRSIQIGEWDSQSRSSNPVQGRVNVRQPASRESGACQEIVVRRPLEERNVTNVDDLLALMASEAFWNQPTGRRLRIQWTGIVNWPGRESNNELPWNRWNCLIKVSLSDESINVFICQNGFQKLKNFAWKSCACFLRIVGIRGTCPGKKAAKSPWKRMQQLMNGSIMEKCVHVLFEMALRDAAEYKDMFMRALDASP